MFAAASIVLAVSSPGSLALGRVGRSHALLDSATVSAVMSHSQQGEIYSSKFEIHYSRPDRARVVVDQNPGTGVRQIAVDSRHSTFFLADLMQYVVADLPTGGTLGARLKTVDDTLEGIVYAILDPDGVSEWFQGKFQFNDWTRSNVRGEIVLNHEGQGGRISVHADRKTFLLSKMEFRTDGSDLDWSFDFTTPAGRLEFVPPEGAYRIPTFDPGVRPPTYANKDAEEKTVKLFAAYDELTKIAYEVVSDGAMVSVWINGNDIRQQDETLDWSYDGTTLRIHVLQSGRYLSAKLNFREVIDVIGNMGTRVDPSAKLIVTNANPYRKWLGDGQKVRVSGSIKIDGNECTMLTAEGQGREINLIYRNDTGMVISSQTIDVESDRPRVLGEQRFRYLPAPNSASKTTIPIPAGTKWSDATVLLSRTR
ncbi:MAG: hypothetical protein IH944_08370 [Armatimonadetes bacterium]|nr:hypothetical protein [Armatimonadota bacterium]